MWWCKMKKVLINISIIVSILICALLLSCNILFKNYEVFSNKYEAIAAVKLNKEQVQELSIELCNVYKNNKYIVIENKQKIFNNSIKYKTKLCDSIFKKLKLNDIRVYPYEKKVFFSIKIKANYDYPIIIYSISDNKYYDLPDYDNNDNKTILEYKNWSASFDNKREKYGWYKEKIENFFYYQERYYDGFHCIKYIKDDLKQMKEYNEIYNRFTQYFDD